MTASDLGTAEALNKILGELTELRLRNAALEAKVDSLAGAATLASPSSHARRLSSNGLSPLNRPVTASALSQILSGSQSTSLAPGNGAPDPASALGTSPPAQPLGPSLASAGALPSSQGPSPGDTPDLAAQKSGTEGYYSTRVILSTYPGQAGIKPLPLNWFAREAKERGPIVASRHPNSIKIRNAIGAYGGSYSIFRALSIAQGKLNPHHRPDYTNTEPPWDVPPNESWFTPGKIVTLDPWGHLAPRVFKKEFDDGVDVRPTIAISRAHIKIPELDQAYREGKIPVDGKIVVRSDRLPGHAPDYDPGIEADVLKAAVDPVWYLPGVAERLGVSEGNLRRALFEDTGGMYPELLTRHDLETFLPPIGGSTAYIFGPPEFLSDPTKEVTCRVHDECQSSDVFGSDLCSCRPFLEFGIEEAIRCAQRGGIGIVVYNRKEGRNLGEVTKLMVYNARKRGTDSASQYFARTENVAGVQDMRVQELMPDVLHWLGVKKIDNMISMSNMKYDAIVRSGIPIHNRYELPPELIPADSKVEIQAKIHAGYFSNHAVTAEDLEKVVGRTWEDMH